MTENNGWENLMTEIVQWKEEGQTVEGEFVTAEPFTEGEFGECMKYVLEGPDGVCRSTVLGSAADKQLGSRRLEYGQYIRITFLGVKALDGGRRVNVFDVKRRKPPLEEK